MDKMLMYELDTLISNIHKKSKESWEQARMIAYVIALSNSSKKLKPSDIMRFAWDDESTKKGDTSISNEDILRLRTKAKQYTIQN